MWSPDLSANFGIRKNDIVDQNITLEEIVAMYDALKGHSG
jgi:hypothetical protein